MSTRAGLALLLLACIGSVGSVGASDDLPPRDPRSVDDAEIVTAAEFALDELKKLSDSGVYETLSLQEVVSAATQTGVFHFNYFLTLQLASPHFKDGKPSAPFEVMVMRNLEDGVFSFAIDEFPVMDEDAIESFWIEKVERHRKLREQSFAAMEAEALEEEEREAQQAAGGGGESGGGAKDEL